MEDTIVFDRAEVPGGAYLQNGRWVNANGEAIDGPPPRKGPAPQSVTSAVPTAPTVVDISGMTLAELEAALNTVTDPATIRAMQAQETAGKARAGAHTLFEARLTALGT